MYTRKKDIMNIVLEHGRGDYYSELLDKYDGEDGRGYKLDTKDKEEDFLDSLSTLLKEDFNIEYKLTLLNFLVYQVSIT